MATIHAPTVASPPSETNLTCVVIYVSILERDLTDVHAVHTVPTEMNILLLISAENTHASNAQYSSESETAQNHCAQAAIIA